MIALRIRHSALLRFSPALLLAAAVAAGGRPAASADDAKPLPLLEQQAFNAAVARVAPSVVRIETIGGKDRVGRMLVGSGTTTGLVVDPEGYIISSAFAFVHHPTSVLIRLPNGERKPADLVATDHNRMLALLKIQADAPLPVPEYAPRDEMRVGQWAIAVGRTFEPEEPNMAVGVVSALNRIWGKAIQTDAAVSPNNYGGPLIDIQGRILGVLAPMSPKADNEMAGIQWYDSGIGFAVVAEDVFSLLPRLKKGDDLYPGLLGISLPQHQLYTGEPVIAACQPRSPAAEAGLEAGDRVVEVDGQKITRPAQIKEILGRLYAGDRVEVVVVRRKKGDEDKQRLKKQIELVKQLDPFERPWLGILPLRDVPRPEVEIQAVEPSGVGVRWVYPEGPALAAGIQPGDVILRCDDQEVASADALRRALLESMVGEEVALQVQRGQRELELSVRLEPLPEGPPPAELPPPRTVLVPPAKERPPVGIQPLQLAEWKNEAWAFVPEEYDPAVPYGMLIWLHADGDFDHEEAVDRWREACAQNDLILLLPRPSDPQRWHPDELEFLRALANQLAASYNVDRHRVVAGGHGSGGTLAYMLAFANRDFIHGIAAVGAPMIGPPPPVDPLQPLAVTIYAATESRYAQLINRTIERLREAGYPVTVHSLGQRPRRLDAMERDQLGRWIDMLDRI